jgi:dTDP-4-amino-4,6-dideoxygalactose transaminase
MPDQWFYSHYIYGSTYRLSEWQGAVLTQQLGRLDEQAAVRTRSAAYLDKCLPEIEGIRPQSLDPRVTRNGHYCYIFHYDRAAFQGLPTEAFIAALNAEGIPTQASYPSVRKLDVFQNGEFRKRLSPDHAREEFSFLHADMPVTDDAAANTVWLVHRTLLGSPEDTAEIATAIKKIQLHAGELV